MLSDHLWPRESPISVDAQIQSAQWSLVAKEFLGAAHIEEGLIKA